MAIAVSLICSIALPVLLSVYAMIKRQSIPLILGVIAFTVSQLLLRIPILQLLANNSVYYSLFQVTNPILFLAIIALSAGVFEESARYIAMRFFMRNRKATSAIYFGIGHGGIEAIVIVGVPILIQLSTILLTASEINIYLGAIERVFAIAMHVCLSIIVFYSVKKQKKLNLLLAIVLHGLTNFIVVFVSMKLNAIVAEVIFLAIVVILIGFSLYVLRRINNDEK